MSDQKIIAICSSVSFYQDLFEIESMLKKMGFKVLLPKTARKMKKLGDFGVKEHKTWLDNPSDYKKKKQLMDDEFKNVFKSDAILVVNNKKNGVKGYIGGNVLMEMTLAYIEKKPIYLWNDIEKNSVFEEEIRAMGCIILNQDLGKIKILGSR